MKNEDINKLHAIFDRHKFPRDLQCVIFQYLDETIHFEVQSSTKITFDSSSSWNYCYWFVVIAVFLSSLAMILFGCNADVPGGCLLQVFVVGNFTSYDVTTGICCDIEPTADGSSCKNDDYSCCNAEATLWTARGSCNCYFAATHDCNASKKIGTSIETVMNKFWNECSPSLEDSRNTWIAGVLFLTLSGLFGCSSLLIRFKIQKIHQHRPPIDLRLWIQEKTRRNNRKAEKEEETKNQDKSFLQSIDIASEIQTPLLLKKKSFSFKTFEKTSFDCENSKSDVSEGSRCNGKFTIDSRNN